MALLRAGLGEVDWRRIIDRFYENTSVALQKIGHSPYLVVPAGCENAPERVRGA
ncbi:hypothetical protein FBY35_2141 [Streptomyces sp. SLBN-118]|uniref:hypothetical protein n=1 Tax=Streptomyces sp. SLBN-118 TaxID=2768454 RepID=UPI00116CE955|nr:hypothetical protein [Streptomyces sp. SLBN-118]TQK51725.1 hypothetical protein FBY35_2141 [Streptomyces sp. SLBN-118]